MIRFFDKLLIYLLYLIIFLILTGGYKYKGEITVELSQVDSLGIAFLLLWGTLKYFHKSELLIEKKLQSIYVWITEEDNAIRLFKVALIYYATLLTLGHTFKYLSLSSHGLDQSFIHQPLFYPFFKEKLLYCDLCPNKTFFGEHTTFTFLLIAPITMLLKNDIVVFFLNTLFLFGGIFLLVKYGPLKELKKWWFYAFLIVFSSRGLRNTGVWEFREEHIVFLFLSLALLSLYHRKIWAYLLSIILILLTKENMPYFIPFLVFPIFFEKSFPLSKKERHFLCLATIFLSLGSMILIFKWAIPYFNDNIPKTDHMIGRISGVATTTKELILKILFHPPTWWFLFTTKVLKKIALKYMFILIIPFVMMAHKRWWWLVACAPIIAMNVLVDTDNQRMMIFHYELPVIPLLFFMVLLSIKENFSNQKRMIFFLVLALAFSERWPGQFISQYFPTLTEIKDVRWLKSIDVEEKLTTNMKTMGYTAHLPNQAWLDNRAYESNEAFWKINNERTNFGGGTEGAKYLLLDLSERVDQLLLQDSLNLGWKSVSNSPSKRFELLKKSE